MRNHDVLYRPQTRETRRSYWSELIQIIFYHIRFLAFLLVTSIMIENLSINNSLSFGYCVAGSRLFIFYYSRAARKVFTQIIRSNIITIDCENANRCGCHSEKVMAGTDCCRCCLGSSKAELVARFCLCIHLTQIYLRVCVEMLKLNLNTYCLTQSVLRICHFWQNTKMKQSCTIKHSPYRWLVRTNLLECHVKIN